MSSVIRPPRPKHGRYFEKPTATQARLERERRRSSRPSRPRKANP